MIVKNQGSQATAKTYLCQWWGSNHIYWWRSRKSSSGSSIQVFGCVESAHRDSNTSKDVLRSSGQDVLRSKSSLNCTVKDWFDRQKSRRFPATPDKKGKNSSKFAVYCASLKFKKVGHMGPADKVVQRVLNIPATPFFIVIFLFELFLVVSM